MSVGLDLLRLLGFDALHLSIVGTRSALADSALEFGILPEFQDLH